MYAVGIGIFFAAVYLRTKNFISIMIAHGLIDGISLASNPNSQLSTGQSTPPLISWVIFGLITLYFIYVSIKYVNKNNTDKINRIWQ
jgi:membrane protease YdiL (CAAX protease family)